MALSFKNLFNKTASSSVDFSFIGTDMHSHLIPAVDDGSPDLTSSLALISRLKKLGYKKLITTPHIIQDYYPNDAQSLQAGYELLQEALTKTENEIEIKVAAEYYLDNYVMELLETDTPLLTLSGNKVLVEFSMVNPPMHRDPFLFQLRLKGYEPIIAHPERYTYYHQDMAQYKTLFDNGFAMQLNLLSFTGQYGKKIQKTAQLLLENGWVKYLGTDMHHLRHAERLEDLLKNQKLIQKLASYPWQNHEL